MMQGNAETKSDPILEDLTSQIIKSRLVKSWPSAKLREIPVPRWTTHLTGEDCEYGAGYSWPFKTFLLVGSFFVCLFAQGSAKMGLKIEGIKVASHIYGWIFRDFPKINVHEVWVDVIFHDPWNCSAQGGDMTVDCFSKVRELCSFTPLKTNMNCKESPFSIGNTSTQTWWTFYCHVGFRGGTSRLRARLGLFGEVFHECLHW